MADKSDIERAIEINDELGFSPASIDFSDVIDVAQNRALRSAVRHLTGNRDFVGLLDTNEIRIPERFENVMPILVDCFIDGFKSGWTTSKEQTVNRRTHAHPGAA